MTLGIVHLSDGTVEYHPWWPREFIERNPQLNCPFGYKTQPPQGRPYPDRKVCPLPWQYRPSETETFGSYGCFEVTHRNRLTA